LLWACDALSMSKCLSEKTVWAFRENLTKIGLTEDLFTQFKSR
jgi:hypothetical protein